MPRQKRNLSKEKIIEAGLELVKEEGVPAVSIRKLADRLGVTPMALYRHVGNKEDLLGELLDQFIRQADVLPAEELPWEQWLMYVSNKMYLALREQPSWMPVFNQIQLKPGALEVMDACLGTLMASGFSSSQALLAFQSMIHCMLGASLMYANTHGGALMDSGRFDITSYPNMSEALGDLVDINRQDQMAMSMRLLTDGLKQSLKNSIH